EFQPADAVLEKWQATVDEVEVSYSEFVIKDWYKQIRPAITRKLRESDGSISEYIAWTRRDLDNSIAAAIARNVTGYDDDVYLFVTGSMTPAQDLDFQRLMNDNEELKQQTEKVRAVLTDVRERFPKRFELEIQGKLRLSIKKASFGMDGFYAIVGGHLPVNGKKPEQQAPPPPNRDDR